MLLLKQKDSPSAFYYFLKVFYCVVPLFSLCRAARNVSEEGNKAVGDSDSSLGGRRAAGDALNKQCRQTGVPAASLCPATLAC